MSVLLIFLDGVGIGQDDPIRNPFSLRRSMLSRFSDEPVEELPARLKNAEQNDMSVMQEIVESDSTGRYPSFRAIFRNYHAFLKEHEREYERGTSETETGGRKEIFRSIDARLGIPGIPQSATGQASLLTGANVSRIVGGHLAGLPNIAIREIITSESIFTKLAREGLRGTFANAFTDIFFKREKPRISASTQSALAGGIKLRMTDDVKNGKALYHDFTNFFLREMGYDLEIFSPRRAGEILAEIACEHDFTLYEYFITDIMGHRGDLQAASIEVAKVDLFIHSVLACADPRRDLVIVTSDHGNMEDIAVKTHTLNRVPLICWGKGSEEFSSGIHDISDIAGKIISFFA